MGNHGLYNHHSSNLQFLENVFFKLFLFLFLFTSLFAFVCFLFVLLLSSLLLFVCLLVFFKRGFVFNTMGC